MKSSIASVQKTRVVALIGNPNTGKSSLFNALCSMNARVGNYPGVTVEQKIGHLTGTDQSIEVVDLPGTYSLAARSADEAVAVNVLSGMLPKQAAPELVVVILDASNIERNLYLFSQVYELGLPVILVLNMWDRLQAEGIQIDAGQISKRLGVPVVCTSAHKREGIHELRLEILKCLNATDPTIPSVPVARSQFPEAFLQESNALRCWLETLGKRMPIQHVDRMLIDSDGHFQRTLCQSGLSEINDRIALARERLRELSCKIPMFETKVRYEWVRHILNGIVVRETRSVVSVSDRIDQWLTHRWFGMIFFIVVMFLVFQSITLVADWPMKGIEQFQSWVGDGIESVMAPGALRSLLVDGIIAGVGAVVVFVPQIAILFFFIAVLEDCGYMSRAAFVMDKLMSSIGLSGKSFLPLMSSFACAVPGIMATRTIENRMDRMVTLLIAPLMSCSARMPVYVLMVSAFVPNLRWAGGWISMQGIVLLLMQAVGAIVAIPVAWALKRFVFPGHAATFLMELHSYKWPSLYVIQQRVLERIQSFVMRAGSLIFVTSILVWAAGYFPGDHQPLNAKLVELESSDRTEDEEFKAKLESEVNVMRSALIENSFLGMAGRSIEPVVRPLGWDWKIGVAVLASFPAREVIIATLGTIYSLGTQEDENSQGLQAKMIAAQWPDGRPVFQLATAMSIMVFFALCAQCSATLMTIRRETNTWRWPIFSFLYMTILAYIGALLTYQLFSMWQ